MEEIKPTKLNYSCINSYNNIHICTLDAYLLMFLSVTPDPTMTGRLTAARTLSTSLRSVAIPVSLPVTITPSLQKNSAALAVSVISRSDVTACDLEWEWINRDGN